MSVIVNIKTLLDTVVADNTDAQSAITAATNAGQSESNALIYAGNASDSADAALLSENNASTSESNALGYANAASGYATTAEGHATSTASDLIAVANILDSFDDRYLGAKASDPTLDNDGNALLVGAIYYNTTDNTTRFYTGSVWDVPEASASTSASNSADSASYSAEWANKAHGVLVSVSAGGDNVDDYSALHWAVEANSSAVSIASSAAQIATNTSDISTINTTISELPANLTYDNTISGLTSTTVKTAIDEINSNINTITEVV